MNYDHNKKFGLFQFQSGYRKLYLNSPKGYSRKNIKAQTAYMYEESPKRLLLKNLQTIIHAVSCI